MVVNDIDEFGLDPLVIELVPKDSRYYKGANVVNYNGEKMYDIPREVDLDTNTDDEVFVVTNNYMTRLDKISNENYQNPKYWWIIALLNDVSNPFLLDFKSSLRIPSLNNLIINGVI